MTIDEYKDKVRANEEAFREWCHKKWVVMPGGTMAVLAWIDFYYEVLDKGEDEPLQ